jgi:hypothetical protein
MWLFTKYGFFSAVCAREGAGEHHQLVNPARIMVRARLRSHLEDLQKRFPSLIGDCDIRAFPGTDYAYRLFVDKSVWSKVVAELSEELDYDNFKAAVADFQGRNDGGYEDALHDVWEVVHRLQK